MSLALVQNDVEHVDECMLGALSQARPCRLVEPSDLDGPAGSIQVASNLSQLSVSSFAVVDIQRLQTHARADYARRWTRRSRTLKDPRRGETES